MANLPYLVKPPHAPCVSRTGQAPRSARSLKLQFDRTQNLASFGVAQPVYLKPESYRFRAWVRARGSRFVGQARDLSADQGQLQVMDASGRAYFTTEPLLGSISVKGGSSKEKDWKLVERTFQAGESKGLQRVHIDMRTASLKFDG